MTIYSSQISETQIPIINKDGLVDIFIGFGIIFAGVLLWIEVVWMIAVFIPAFLPSFHKRVIEPRIGKFVTNSNQYQINLKITLYVLLIIGVLVLADFFVYYFVRQLFSWTGIAELLQSILQVFGIIFASLWIFSGAMLSIRRYYLYAALAFVVMIAR